MNQIILLLSVLLLINNKVNDSEKRSDIYSGSTKKSDIYYYQEKYLDNIKQLTFGGDNAEAYFSFDDTHSFNGELYVF